MDSATPSGLAVTGAKLWADLTEAHELDAGQLVQLLEACRAADRLDRLAVLIDGSDDDLIGGAQRQAVATANLLKQLLAALRLPDAAGRKPQYRGSRVQRPSVATGMSAVDRLRAAKSS
jgi:hypothetical protein